MAELRSGLDSAIAGRGHLFLISGEPGIGKSRLAEEVSTEAAQRAMRVLWGRCWEGRGAPAYWPWIQVIRALASSTEPAARRMMFESEHTVWMVETVAQIVPELRAFAPHSLKPAINWGDPEQARFRLFDSVATLLKNIARLRPVAILLDDLHDADYSSLAMLRWVARELAGAGVLIIGTYRDVEVRRSPGLSKHIGNLSREARSIQLAGLSQAEVAEFVVLSSGRTPDDQLISRLHAATAGNPLFVDGVVRTLIADRNGGIETASDHPFKIPDTLREAIGRRLAVLSEEAHSLLKVAAGIGNEFEADLCARVGGVSRDEFNLLLDEASIGGIVRPLGQRCYRFAHALIRAVVYDALDTNTRLRLHRLIGAAIEESHAANLTPHLAALANHFAQAAQVEKAIDYSFRAGQAAEDVSAYEQAMLHYEKGLRLIGIGEEKSDKKLRADFLARLGQTRAFFGLEARRGIEECETAIKLYEKLGLYPEAAAIHARLGLQLSKDDDESMTSMPRAMVHFERAQRELERGPENAALVWLYLGSAVAAWKSLDLKKGLTACQRGLEMSVRLNLADEIGYFHCVRGHLYLYAGRIAEALAPLTVESGDPALLARIAKANGEIRRRLWNPADAKPWLVEGLAGPGIAKLPMNRKDLIGDLAAAHILTGSLEEARVQINQASTVLLHGVMAFHDGDWREAESAFEVGLSNAGASGARERQVDLSFWYARLHRRNGQNAAAISMLEDLLGALGDGSLPLIELWLRPECILSHAQASNLEEAQVQLARCHEIIAAGVDWLGLTGAVVRAEAVVASMEDRLPEADVLFARAMAIFTRFALPWERAETLILWSSTLAASGDLRGEQKFDEAIATYRQYHAAERWIERVQTERKRLRQMNVKGADTRSGSPAESSFHKDGDFWTVTHQGKTFRLRNLKGLEYIAYLLAHPGVRIHACDLVAMVEGGEAGGPAASPARARAEGLEASHDLGDAGEALDPQAISAYRRRLIEVREELAEAERNNDSGALERARHEYELLSGQLSAGVGTRGRIRRSSSHVERARWLVTKNIRTSVERIRRNNPKLGDHFAISIHTGAFCAYLPDLENKPSWQT